MPQDTSSSTEHRHTLSPNQQQVLRQLEQAHEPLSAYALLDRLRPDGFSAPTQVYRALARLISLGVAHRLESLNAYVSCACATDHSQGQLAFTICDHCGAVDELAGVELGRTLHRRLRERRFVVASTTIELHGRCANCSASADS